MFRWPDAVISQPQGPGIDDGWGRNGGHGGDEVDDGIEVVVIPIAADPRGVRWVRVGERRQPGEQDGNSNREYATGTAHGANHCRMARTSQVPLWAELRRRPKGIFRFASGDLQPRRRTIKWRDYARPTDHTNAASITHNRTSAASWVPICSRPRSLEMPTVIAPDVGRLTATASRWPGRVGRSGRP